MDKKPKRAKIVKVWCEFSGRVDLGGLNTWKNQKTTHMKNVKPAEYGFLAAPVGEEVNLPKKQYARCPKCGRRLQATHIVVDRYTYLFSTIARHKRRVKK